MKTETRKILIRADTVKQARRFAESHRKKMSSKFLPERIVSVKLNRSQGLAGGVKAYTVILKRKLDTRPRTKRGSLYKSYQGRSPRL